MIGILVVLPVGVSYQLQIDEVIMGSELLIQPLKETEGQKNQSEIHGKTSFIEVKCISLHLPLHLTA